MFHSFLRRAQGPARGILRFPNRRAFSYVSTHQTFPASLYRFQIHRDSKLYDRAVEQDDWEYEDGVEISADGLVHPNITADCTRKQIHIFRLLTFSVSNGALFMPNTHFMQEITRRSFDNYLDNVESGQHTAEPHYLCIPKGQGLNKMLTQFYLHYRRVFNPDDWLGRHPYHEASFDDQEEWMNT
ncbi:hypothetical protein N7539_006016 [Penicillium diatomitis]|uniref:Tse2 ADP-ribosyltransferase toxin domain-containing protein n=1 Tax=Penicillium diatomitis TaxID=2819901 RepID=A0A9W9X4W5_9EURO|nr:uncharacterized protein N7539_006016 [Penicillium diatomitis]KAJ5483816.1 hypothetical protein N7539_006016 [Penicillium diatomitis]